MCRSMDTILMKSSPIPLTLFNLKWQKPEVMPNSPKDPCEENLWKCVVAFRGYKFKTMSGLPFTYTLKKGRGDEFTKELWIDRREDSKSLAWSSVRLAYHNIGKIGEVVDRPKALGDIRGVSYIYGLFYRFGLIDVPDKVKEKMGGKEH